jgi:hypothetical protein
MVPLSHHCLGYVIASLFSQLLFGEVIILSLVITNTTATFVRRSQDVRSHRGCCFKLPRHPMVDYEGNGQESKYMQANFGETGIIGYRRSFDIKASATPTTALRSWITHDLELTPDQLCLEINSTAS